MTVSVVTCWLNHLELLPAYEAAVAGAEVVIVDQASDRETAVALDAMVERLGHGSRVIHNVENVHFGPGCNQGALQATGEILVMLNNDVVGRGEPPHAWLTQVERDVSLGGLYGPSVQVFDVDGEGYAYIEGWCICVSRETWKLLGGFDVRNFPREYVEDVDLSWRARLAGCGLYQTRWPIHHLGNVTNKSIPGADAYAEPQREVFRQRVRRWRAANP